MNDDSSNNGSGSATRQPSEHSNYGKLTEAEFLVHEAELAKTAMSTALADLKGNLAKVGDIKLWTHHYPWLAVGVAAASGFTLAAVANKGGAKAGEADDHESERQRLVRETAKAPYQANAAGTRPKVGESILGSLFNLARTALEASLVSAIHDQGVERAYGRASAECASRAATPSETPSPATR
jgi:hypothetical protein